MEDLAAHEPRPPFFRRLLSRFLLLYLVLYSLPFPIGALPLTEELGQEFERGPQATAIAWFGANVLGIEQNLAWFATGSGDTTRDYVRLALIAAIALPLAAAWAAFARRALNVHLHDLLRSYVRFVLGATMLGYGVAKFFGGQFSEIQPFQLVTPWGESSPMGVVWRFMGVSPTYTAITGVIECTGGALLLWRRTAALGAIVTAGAMTQVVLLNFCYDVPVKQYSAHLLFMALFVLARDWRRLTGVLWWHRTVEPLPLHPPMPAWLLRTRRVVQIVLIGAILYGSVTSLYAGWMRSQEPEAPLQGAYEVVEFVRDGEVVPPLVTDATRWRYVSILRWGVRVLMADGRTQAFFRHQADEERGSLRLDTAARGAPPLEHVLAFRREPRPGPELPLPPPAPGSPVAAAPPDLVLEGMLQGAAVRLRLRPLGRDDFFLTKSRFHWIQEYPLNR